MCKSAEFEFCQENSIISTFLIINTCYVVKWYFCEIFQQCAVFKTGNAQTTLVLVEYECVDELLRRYFWGFKGGVADVGKIPKKNGTTHWKLQFLTTTHQH